jgi:hypothetical protein
MCFIYVTTHTVCGHETPAWHDSAEADCIALPISYEVPRREPTTKERLSCPRWRPNEQPGRNTLSNRCEPCHKYHNNPKGGHPGLRQVGGGGEGGGSKDGGGQDGEKAQ